MRIPADSAVRFEKLCDWCRRFLCSPAGAVLSSFVIVAAGILWCSFADPDLFARVAVGHLISKDGIYLTDPFSFTPRKPVFIDHEWFAGYLLYWIAKTGGDQALAVFSLSTLIFSVIFLHKAARVWTASSSSIFFPCFFFGVVQCGYIWGSIVRSQVLTYLFLPVVFWGIALFERRGEGRILFLLPLIMLVWANSHGGFVTGFGFMLLYLVVLSARREWRKCLAVLAVSASMVAATAVNPYGFGRFWGFILEAVSMSRSSISEWGPYLPDSWENMASYIYFLLAIIGIWMNRRKRDWMVLLFLGAALFQGVMHMRLVAIAAMVVIVFFEEEFGALPRKLAGSAFVRSGSFVLCGLTAAALCFVFYTALNFHSFSLNYSAYPVETIEWLRRSGLKGTLLVDFNNGSFAMWRLFPRFLVSVDGRYEEVYPEETVQKVSDAMNPRSETFPASFRELAPDFALFRTGESVKKALELIPELRVFRWGPDYTLLGRGVPVGNIDEASIRPDDMWEPFR